MPISDEMRNRFLDHIREERKGVQGADVLDFYHEWFVAISVDYVSKMVGAPEEVRLQGLQFLQLSLQSVMDSAAGILTTGHDSALALKKEMGL